ncbi:hypothetical protein TRVL_08352 [Trypanosoma vivax]|nr:hypothetical protein TRVL_08352 [Trypanosoma vivax]
MWKMKADQRGELSKQATSASKRLNAHIQAQRFAKCNDLALSASKWKSETCLCAFHHHTKRSNGAHTKIFTQLATRLQHKTRETARTTHTPYNQCPNEKNVASSSSPLSYERYIKQRWSVCH